MQKFPMRLEVSAVAAVAAVAATAAYIRRLRAELAAQRPMQPPTAGGLSWWLWPLRGGRGRGLRRFAAVVAEVFAPSWWSRRRSFIHRYKNNAKNRITCDFRLFHHRNLLGVCASSRHLRRQAIFSANHRKKEEKTRKKTTSTAVGGGHVAVFAAPPWRSRRSFADTAGGLCWRSFLVFNLAVKTP